MMVFLKVYLVLSSIFLLSVQGQADFPLDPLSPQEILFAAQIINYHVPNSNSWGFNYIQLKEPPKSVLLPYFLNNTVPEFGDIPRKAFAIVIDKTSGKSYEAITDLDMGQIDSWKEIPGILQPMCSLYEDEIASEIVRKDPNVVQKCADVGFPNMDMVILSGWSMGYVGDKTKYVDGRFVQMFLFGQNFVEDGNSPGDNYYAHPFPFVVIVDVVNKTVVEIVNLATREGFDTTHGPNVKVPRQEHQYDQQLLGQNFVRKDIKPLHITFPEGASYTITGNLINWQKFKFRVGFNGREGLVLHHLSYNDDGNVRPIIYRAALSEMFVPYGDARPPFHQKTVFDEGDYGMGITSSPLVEGTDCIGAVHMFSGYFSTGDGNATYLPNRICVTEEDAGYLWKHTDEKTGKMHVARSRRLSLSFVSRIDNYDYAFFWHLYQDASIQLDVKLTGILNTNMVEVGTAAHEHSIHISPGLVAQFHQHVFAVRIDLDVDGPNNSVSMVELVASEEKTGSKKNPYGQGVIARVTPLETAAAARTNISPLDGRVWKFSNPNSINKADQKPVAWKLIPGNHQSLLMKMDSPVRIRANFSAFDVWVTRYDDDQIFAAGDYIGQNDSEGLPKWVAENESAIITNTDIVLWHVFGVSHLPRLEDWPVMPVESCGFWLKPAGFFTRNPGLDVPALQSTK